MKTGNIKYKIISFVLIYCLTAWAYAVVPTTDIYQQSTDTTTLAQYSAQVGTYLSQMTSTMNAYDQVKNLQGLQSVQGAGTQVCALCNKSDIASLSQYSTNVNSDLCSQFSLAMSNITGASQSITSLQQIMATFATNPKAATIALQQASAATMTVSQNTLAQMQMLETQGQQRLLAKEKLEQTSTADAFDGFHSGL
ncbi:MAG: hypothetical protein QG673_1696 [Pseudomonadota bacterium]|nr:hypothetical protein [Pseudomonadota bacterium]